MDNGLRGAVELNGEDLQEHYEERAAIMEYDGGIPRYAAEADAWNSVNLLHRQRLTRARNG